MTSPKDKLICPLTPEERRQLVEAPIVIRVHGQSYRSSGVSFERQGLHFRLKELFWDVYPSMED